MCELDRSAGTMSDLFVHTKRRRATRKESECPSSPSFGSGPLEDDGRFSSCRQRDICGASLLKIQVRGFGCNWAHHFQSPINDSLLSHHQTGPIDGGVAIQDGRWSLPLAVSEESLCFASGC